MRPEGLGKFKKNHLIRYRTRDLPVCSSNTEVKFLPEYSAIFKAINSCVKVEYSSTIKHHATGFTSRLVIRTTELVPAECDG
jgi:hypothetical protein